MITPRSTSTPPSSSLPSAAGPSAPSWSTWAATCTRASTSPGIPPPTRTGSARTCWSWSASSASPSSGIPGGNFVSGYRWEDGVGSGGRAADPPRPGLADDRDQRVRPQRVRPVGGQGRTSSRCWRSTSARGACRRRSTCSSTPTIRGGTYWSDLRVEPRSQGAARDPDVVPGQRDGRAVADRAQDGGGVRAAGRRDGPGHAAVRPAPRARRVRQLPPRRCRPSAPGRPRSSTSPTTSSTTSPRTPTTSSRGTTWRASSPRRSTWRASSGTSSSTADHVGGTALHDQAHQHLLRRVERLVRAGDARAGPAEGLDRGAAAQSRTRTPSRTPSWSGSLLVTPAAQQ